MISLLPSEANPNNQRYGKVFDATLIILYVLFIFSLSYLRGPVYHLVFAETSYILLFNGVNLLKGEPLGFIVHSLPLIEAGAVVTLLLHTLEGGFSLAESAVKNAETYSLALDIVIFVFVGMGMIKFFRCLRRFFGLMAGIFALLPFLAMDPWGYLMILHGGPEFFGLGCAFWSLSFLISGAGGQRRSVVIAGIFAGLGFAAKINFFPVLCALLLVARPLAPFFVSVMATIGVVYLPVLGQWKEWLTHFGASGVVWQGNPTSQKGISGIFEGIQIITEKVPSYLLIVFIIIVVQIIKISRNPKVDEHFTLAGSSIICGLFALTLTSLRPVHWYLISSLPFLSVGVALSFNYIYATRWNFGRKIVLPVFASLLWTFTVAGFILETKNVWGFAYPKKDWAQEERLLLGSRDNCAIILEIGSTHPLAAIFHSDHYSRGVLNESVRHNIPSRFYWHYLELPDQLFDSAGKALSASQVVQNYPCALISGVPLQEDFRPAYVNPPTSFEVDTYCPNEPTYGYNCSACAQNRCLGFVKNYKLKDVSFSVEAPDNSFPSYNLVDGNVDTFWELTSTNPIMVEFKSESFVVPDRYSLSTGYHGEGGMDSTSRMPRRWKFYGKKANEKWILLDDRVTDDWAPRETRFFDLNSTARFSRFKFEFGVPQNKTIRIYEISFVLKENIIKLNHPDEAPGWGK